MIAPIARLVTRLLGEGDGLILGALLRTGQGLLKPNTVYELYQEPIGGMIVLREVGESCIGVSPQTVPESFGQLHWSLEVGQMMDSPNSKFMFLSKAEVKEYCTLQDGE